MPVLFSNVGAFGVAIATATLAFSGHAPSVAITGNENVPMSQGAATFTGYAPNAYVPGTMAMGPGLVFGLNLQSDPVGIRTPNLGELSFLGYQPVVENSGGGIETLGSDDLYALDATISGTGTRVLITSVTRIPLKGSAAFSGLAPKSVLSIIPPVGAGTFGGYAVSLTYSGITTSAGGAEFAGYAPTALASNQIVVPSGSGAFAGYAPSTSRVLSPNKANATFASNFLTLAETRPVGSGSGTFTGYAPTKVSTGARYDGSGDIASRRATMGGITWVMVWPTDSDITPEPSTIVGTGVGVWPGSGSLVSQFATINREGWAALGVMEAEPATIWGGGIHRPYLPINAVDITVSSVEVTMDVSAPIESTITANSVDVSSGY